MIRPTVVKVTHLMSLPRSIRRPLTTLQVDILETASHLAALAAETGDALVASYSYYAKKCDCSEKTVQRAFERFAELGYVRKMRRWPLRWSEWRTNLYEFNAELLAWARREYRQQVREYLNRTFETNYQDSNKNNSCKKQKKAPPGDSSPSSRLARQAQEWLFRIPLRAPPPEPTD